MHKTNVKILFLEKELNRKGQVKQKLGHEVQIYVCRLP